MLIITLYIKYLVLYSNILFMELKNTGLFSYPSLLVLIVLLQIFSITDM